MERAGGFLQEHGSCLAAGAAFLAGMFACLEGDGSVPFGRCPQAGAVLGLCPHSLPKLVDPPPVPILGGNPCCVIPCGLVQSCNLHHRLCLLGLDPEVLILEDRGRGGHQGLARLGSQTWGFWRVHVDPCEVENRSKSLCFYRGNVFESQSVSLP